MLVGGIVVEDDVDRLASRDLALDGIEKTNEFSSQSVSAVNSEAIGEKPRTLAAVCGWLGT